jgi:hypothetical protein
MPDVHSVFRIIDAEDAAGFAALFARSGSMTFGNAHPMVGPDAIAAGIGSFFAAIAALRHRVQRTWAVGADAITQVEVRYTRLDGREVTLPGVSIWSVDADDAFVDHRVSIDQAPLFAA